MPRHCHGDDGLLTVSTQYNISATARLPTNRWLRLASLIASIQARSPPAQKALPAPVNTINRTLGSRSHDWNTSFRSRNSASFSALALSGLVSVMRVTPR